MHSHLAKMLGTCIYETRERKRFLQKELAEAVGVSAQFLGRIERGDVMIPEPVLEKAITFLDLKESTLVRIYKVSGQKSAEDFFKKTKKLRKAR